MVIKPKLLQYNKKAATPPKSLRGEINGIILINHIQIAAFELIHNLFAEARLYGHAQNGESKQYHAAQKRRAKHAAKRLIDYDDGFIAAIIDFGYGINHNQPEDLGG